MPSVRFEPIKYKSRGYSDKVKTQAANLLQWISERFEGDFRLFTRTWDHKPTIRTQKIGPWAIVTGSSDKPLIFVALGTKPHPIRARRAPALIFQEGYRPKTTPGRIVSVPGGPFGAVVATRSVMHPGTDPRPIHKETAWKWSQEFGRMAQEAINRALS